ncbi:MAG: glycoside hydrolase family 2 TIM barrel-domain containing protein [Huintestinicola sp.]
MSKNTLICDNWEFCKTPFGTEYADVNGWHHVDVPHDWLIGNTHDLYETSTGWYRRKLDCKKNGNNRTAVRFEGVYMDCTVYVNGEKAGEWKYGYSTFEFDITDLLSEGENEISVRVDHRSPNSRWYSGAGIYRRVWLKEYSDCHILPDGIYISTDISGSVTVTTEVCRPEGVPVSELSVRRTILDGDKVILSADAPCCAYDRSRINPVIRTEGLNYSVNTDTFEIENPVLWDIEAPHLYTCTVELMRNGEVIDRDSTSFGFRKAEFTSDKGFFLNNRHVKIHGCCEHHDLGALGAAFNVNAMRRKLEKLRVMGVNAIRTSHNMPACELMELADEMGFLILSEGFDMWEMPKTEYDYARFFPQWIARDVASWVRRDRNHPSLIGWSVGNEIYDTHAGERGQEIASLLLGLVRENDPRGNGYVTIGSNFMQWENAQKCADIVKLAGYNYAERLYNEHHEKHPDWMIYGSETSSVVQSRGIYHFPLSQSCLADDDEQCSALGNSTTGWAAKNTEACIIPDRDAEFCAGQFIWTGFDYIGEPTPYDTKNSYFGQIDTAGFPKDSAYIFRAEWTDHKKSPFIHIFPYWDFIEGQDIDVRVCTNAPKAALFLNGEKVNETEIDHAHGTELLMNSIVKYTEGELLAIAYDENGKELARDVQRSFGDAAELRLTPDKQELKADDTDLIFIDISAYDKNGTFVANANNRAFVEVTGAGRLIGLDNGDSTDYEQYKGTSRRLFSGKLLAIIAAKKAAGDIDVKVTSPSLPDAVIRLKAVDAGVVNGVSCHEENTHTAAECPDEANDIPVRKIAFESESRKFDAEHKEITFKAVVSPANASYKNDIEYRITTVLGIKSNLAEIVSAENGSVTVKCKGDGEFYLRALCKNGTEKYHVVTAMKLCGEGLGAASFDPYSFVAGGLHTVRTDNITNGIERGAGFPWENGWFGFENVDFGSIGSDTVTVPIFANCTTPVKIRFYDGIPTEGGELLGEFTYHETPEWLTYKPATYKLNKVLKGMHTFVIESSDGYDVKGFVFEKPEKEFNEINAADNESVYGDKFTAEPDAVTGIGNNVMLNFGEFDFSETSPSAIVITGKSALPLNSIHVIFTGDTETRVLAEFKGADEYTPRSFALEGIKGRCKVAFAFLPGSDFDFRSFRFEK